MENLNDLKLRILQRLIKIDDIEILTKINEFISQYDSYNESVVNETKSIYNSKIKFSEGQKKMLRDAENDIKEGRFHTGDEVRKMTEEWLK
jgi:hypothetical protein